MGVLRGRVRFLSIRRHTPVTSDRRFVYHGWRPIVEYEALSEDPNVPHRTYTWGVDLSRAGGAAALDGAAGIGGLVAICDPNDPNDPNDTFGSWAVLSDGNGNVVQLIDCTAATVNDAIACHYEYDPYGNRFEPDPNDPNAILDATENWLRFSTKYFDAETGLGYWGYRYYDPQTGRWLTRDPIGERGGVNLYAYVRNATIALVDATGLWSTTVGGRKYTSYGPNDFTLVQQLPRPGRPCSFVRRELLEQAWEIDRSSMRWVPFMNSELTVEVHASVGAEVSAGAQVEWEGSVSGFRAGVKLGAEATIAANVTTTARFTVPMDIDAQSFDLKEWKKYQYLYECDCQCPQGYSDMRLSQNRDTC